MLRLLINSALVICYAVMTFSEHPECNTARGTNIYTIAFATGFVVNALDFFVGFAEIYVYSIKATRDYCYIREFYTICRWIMRGILLIASIFQETSR